MKNFIISFILFILPIHKYRISGHSMHPTLKEGDTILVNRLAYLFSQPQKGDIIACNNPDGREVLIKRIDRVEDKKYFVLGDNKSQSTDSRKFGMLEKKALIGKVIYA